MIFRQWRNNKMLQSQHYDKVEWYLAQILKLLKGGVKNGK